MKVSLFEISYKKNELFHHILIFLDVPVYGVFLEPGLIRLHIDNSSVFLSEPSSHLYCFHLSFINNNIYVYTAQSDEFTDVKIILSSFFCFTFFFKGEQQSSHSKH